MVSLNNFTHLTTDFEKLEYKILSDLKIAQQAFNDNYLYPDLGNLCRLQTRLQDLLQYVQDPDRRFLLRNLLAKIEDLRWEGETIFRFVRNQLRIEWVGDDRSTEFGCVVIGYRPSINATPELHVFCYDRSQFDVDTKQKQRALRLNPIRKVNYQTSPRQIRRNLIREAQPLSRLSTLYIESLDPFPLHRTICPAAVSRMLRKLTGYIR